MIRYAAFFRNVNLGQRGSPTRGQLELAFAQAGAEQAESFMSNGTLVFAAGDDAQARRIIRAAEDLLREACGLVEPGFSVRLETLAALVREDPFRAFADGEKNERSISFFDAQPPVTAAAPLVDSHGSCTVFRLEGGLALSLARAVGGKQGYPTPLLEEVLGRPATTRGWNTVVRLVKKYGMA